MAVKRRVRKLEARAQRVKLTIRQKPHEFSTIAAGIAVGYRRNVGPGVFVLRCADGKGGNWTKVIGTADDFEDADGTNVLTFWQACEKGLKMVRGTDDSAGRPTTVGDAVESYRLDLIAHKRAVANATRVAKRLSPSLAAKVVALLTELDLSTWRDNLLKDGMTPATYVRIVRGFRAALNLAQRRDQQRITNAAAWRIGLGGIDEDYESRNVLRLTDKQVRAVVKCAYKIGREFGLLTETAATTGARIGQLARLIVADLQIEESPEGPRLMMPSSRKGSRRGKAKKATKQPVPISMALARKLQTNRALGEPLLVRADGLAWQSNQNDHVKLYARAAKMAGVKGSITALRHSAIIRMLLAKPSPTPIRLVAVLCDTSVSQIEATYSKYIAHYGDKIARDALLDIDG